MFYGTIALLRAEPTVPDDLAVATCEQLLTDASDLIDDWLGPYDVIQSGTWAGRKVDPTIVDGWRSDRLARATVKMAAHLHREPAILAGAVGSKVSGPDFTVENPAPAKRKIADVIGPLNGSGLRIMGARARP